MASYTTHWKAGTVISALTAYGLVSSHYAYVIESFLLIAIGFLGAIFPDMDSDTGIPIKKIFPWLALLLPITVVYQLPLMHENILTALIFLGISIPIILFPFRWLLKKFTKHRGAFHSIPAAIIFGLFIALFIDFNSGRISLQISCGLIGTVGYLTHLIIDELYAIKLNGIRLPTIKRSFGTALCWRVRSTFITLLMYSLILLLTSFIWSSWEDIPVEQALQDLLN